MLRKYWIAFVAVLFAGASIAATTIPLSNLTDTWNNSGTVYCSICMTISGTASAAGSSIAKFIDGSGSNAFQVDKSGFLHMGAPTNQFQLYCCVADAPLLEGNGTNFQIGSPQITFGSVLNPGINKVSLTGVAIGSLTSCGGSPSTSTNATDFMGSVTTGSGATGCIIAFSATKSAAPVCVVVAPAAGGGPPFSTSTTALTITTASAATVYNWICNDKG